MYSLHNIVIICDNVPDIVTSKGYFVSGRYFSCLRIILCSPIVYTAMWCFVCIYYTFIFFIHGSMLVKMLESVICTCLSHVLFLPKSLC